MTGQLTNRLPDENHLLAGRIADCLWQTSVKRMQENPATIPLLLETWSPEMEQSARFLGFLTAGLPMKWWEQRKTELKVEILKRLIAIDDGRGVITDWVASVIQQERDWEDLKTIAGWKPRKGGWPAVLLEAWSRQAVCKQSARFVRNAALHIIATADLSPEKSPGKPEFTGWTEKDRIDVILKYLSEPEETDSDGLRIIANSMVFREHCDETVLTALLHQWNVRMQDMLMTILPSQPGQQRNQLLEWQSSYRKTIWKKMINIAPHCRDATKVILPWMEYWLPRETELEVLDIMAEWQPADNASQQQLIRLWGQCWRSDNGNCQLAAWKFGWRFLTWGEKPHPGWEDIGGNSLEAMYRFLKMVDEGRLSRKYLPRVLEVIPPPQGLTPKQETEWQTLWIKLFRSSNSEVAGVATTHLLKLVVSGKADREQVKSVIREQLEATSSSAVVSSLLKSIRTWEENHHASGEMFYEEFFHLRQSVHWAHFSLVAMEELTAHLETMWRRGDERPELVAAWLDILHKESNPKVVEYLQKWELGLRKWQPIPDPPSRPFEKSREIWMERTGDDHPAIRKKAWEILFQTGEVSGTFLMKRLSAERDPDVLSVMADWNPPAGEPFPSEFWERWGNCLSEAFEKTFNRIHRMEWIVQSLGKALAAAWFSGGCKDMGGGKKGLVDVTAFQDKLAARFASVRDIHLLQEKCKIINSLFSLEESPEAFQKQISMSSKRNRASLIICLGHAGFSRNWSRNDIPANVKQNLAFMVISTLSTLNAWDVEAWDVGLSILVNLWNHGRHAPHEVPDEVPVGWDRFCEMVEKGTNLKTLPRLIQTGWKVQNSGGRQIFRQMIHRMRASPDLFIAGLIEQVFWFEAAMACESARQNCPEERKTDWQTEWRRLRQIIHVYPAPGDVRPEEPEGRKPDRSGKCKGFQLELWKNIKLVIEWEGQETKRQKTEKQKTGDRLENRKAFFRDPRESGSRSAGKQSNLEKTVQRVPCVQPASPPQLNDRPMPSIPDKRLDKGDEPTGKQGTCPGTAIQRRLV